MHLRLIDGEEKVHKKVIQLVDQNVYKQVNTPLILATIMNINCVILNLIKKWATSVSKEE